MGRTHSRLGSRVFVINNLDENSGLINVSFSGELGSYVDCGRLKSVVTSARGTRTYDFAIATDYQLYEAFDLEGGTGLWTHEHRMSLDGRVNLIVEELSARQTLVTVNSRYELTKTTRSTSTASRGFPSNYEEVITFGVNETKAFPGSGVGTACRATGRLEREILALIN